MKTIDERAIEFADGHEQAELELHGLGHVYGYSRIYNSEKVAYERGATEQKAIDIEKACEWLKNNLREYGIILFGYWESDFRKAMEE